MRIGHCWVINTKFHCWKPACDRLARDEFFPHDPYLDAPKVSLGRGFTLDK